jgi:hypothetical protein
METTEDTADHRETGSSYAALPRRRERLSLHESKEAGDRVRAKVTRADAYDLWGEPEGLIKLNRVPGATRPAGRRHTLISRI